jgi:hypothetical protein
MWAGSARATPQRVPPTLALRDPKPVVLWKVRGEEAGGAGFLAESSVGDHAAVWQSNDGTAWSRVTQLEDLINKTVPGTVDALLGTPHGPVVLGRTSGKMAAWYVDGTQWKEASFGGDPEHDFPETLVHPANGFLAACYRQGSDQVFPSTWTSTNGHDWLSSTSSFDLAHKPISDTFGVALSSIARVGAGWIAAGGGPSARRVWTSTNATHGTTSRFPLPLAKPPIST